jgi:hypothetical protein
MFDEIKLNASQSLKLKSTKALQCSVRRSYCVSEVLRRDRVHLKARYAIPSGRPELGPGYHKAFACIAKRSAVGAATIFCRYNAAGDTFQLFSAKSFMAAQFQGFQFESFHFEKVFNGCN